jgi:hypothetical protein
MKLYHKTPCNECPWRKESQAGWLGGHSPEFYADALALNETPACHCRDHGPDSDETAFCAGALSVMANACIMPDDSKHPGAAEARMAVGRRDDTFGHHALFYKHHTHGEDYTSPMLRRLMNMEGTAA